MSKFTELPNINRKTLKHLVADIGNCRTKLFVVETDTGILYSTVYETPADLHKLFDLFPQLKIGIYAASGAVDSEMLDLINSKLEQFMHFTPQTPVPIKNRYQTPETLGSDRLATAVGVNACFPNTNLIVFDFGTAITIDFIDSNNTFLGGNISPGLAIRFKALHTFTNSLPLISPQPNNFAETKYPTKPTKSNNFAETKYPTKPTKFTKSNNFAETKYPTKFTKPTKSNNFAETKYPTKHTKSNNKPLWSLCPLWEKKNNKPLWSLCPLREKKNNNPLWTLCPLWEKKNNNPLWSLCPLREKKNNKPLWSLCPLWEKKNKTFVGFVPFVGEKKQIVGEKKQIAGEKNTPQVGISTQTAIEAGVINGIIGEIRYYIEKYPDRKIIFTGGDAFYFATKIKCSIFVFSNSIVFGLSKILIHNQQNG
ncbi:MAG: type III pantothenate kinase [Prevotellaceae bacterium]|jgi:pantothenate kinase type III|nr:type III pantothenate kinase [Prevotellaceae bacterium]